MWGVVEIMGHRTRAGALSDATIGGATMLRIEHPTRADHSGDEPLTEYYAPSAIFAIRPCSQQEAADVASWAWPDRTARPALSPAFGELVDDDEVDAELVGLPGPGDDGYDPEQPF